MESGTALMPPSNGLNGILLSAETLKGPEYENRTTLY